MNVVIEKITEWICEGLRSAVTQKFGEIFVGVNEKVTEAAGQLGQTPQSWNSTIFDMIKGLSETVIIPIAGMILTFIMCYELIQMVLEKNNLHDFDTFNIFRWIMKTAIAVTILTNCFPLVMAIFELAQNVINKSSGFITGSMDMQAQLADLATQLEAMGMWELIGLWLELHIVGFCMNILSLCIFIVVWGRIIQIYLMVSLAPIPLSSITNREWGHMGQNYLKSLLSVGFQGFLIMVCLAIYAAMAQSISSASNVHAAIWGTAGYTVLLCFALFKTNSLSKSIFGAH